MTTKPPSAIQEFPPEAIEKIAYNSVATIPTQEPNDRHRLGYHVWRWLISKQGTLEEAIRESGARLLIQHREAAAVITEGLQRQGLPPG